MGEKTIWDGKEERKEYRYYIISLGQEIETFKRAVREHWSIENMHWHLDVTFRKDANTTLDKQAAQNHYKVSTFLYHITYRILNSDYKTLSNHKTTLEIRFPFIYFIY